MSDCQAEGCDRPTHDTYLICARCSDELARDLADTGGLLTDRTGHPLPSLPDELQTTVTRQDKLTVRCDRRGTETGLTWKEAAADAAWVLADTVSTWARDLAAVRNVTLDAATTTEIAAWLHRRVDWLRQHENAGEAHGDLTAAIDNARRAVDLPANRARFQVGPCPETTDDGACDGTVWAYIATGADESLMRCPDCGARWNTTQWLRVGRRIRARREQLERAAA